MGGEIGLSSRVSGEFEPSDSSRVKGVLNSVNQLEAKQAKMKTRAIREYVHEMHYYSIGAWKRLYKARKQGLK